MANIISRKISRQFFRRRGSLKNGKKLVPQSLKVIAARKANYPQIVKNGRESLYYLFEENVRVRGDEDCIWSREGEYSWNEALKRVHQYAQWFLSQGVRPHSLVGFYLQNSPDFMLAWLGLWAIGAAPAMINWNLSGKALVHCVKMSGAVILLVDEDESVRARVYEQADVLQSELGMSCVTLDRELKATIYGLDAKRPENTYRDDVKGNWPMCLFYTR